MLTIERFKIMLNEVNAYKVIISNISSVEGYSVLYFLRSQFNGVTFFCNKLTKRLINFGHVIDLNDAKKLAEGCSNIVDYISTLKNEEIYMARSYGTLTPFKNTIVIAQKDCGLDYETIKNAGFFNNEGQNFSYSYKSYELVETIKDSEVFSANDYLLNINRTLNDDALAQIFIDKLKTEKIIIYADNTLIYDGFFESVANEIKIKFLDIKSCAISAF